MKLFLFFYIQKNRSETKGKQHQVPSTIQPKVVNVVESDLLYYVCTQNK